MPHQSGHVIIKLSSPINSEKPKGAKAWHCLLAALVAGFLLGVLVAS